MMDEFDEDEFDECDEYDVVSGLTYGLRVY